MPSSSSERNQATTMEVAKLSITTEQSEVVPTKVELGGGGGVFAGSPTKWGQRMSDLFGRSSQEKEETELKTITRERPDPTTQSQTLAEPAQDAAPSTNWAVQAFASIDTVARRPRVVNSTRRRASTENLPRAFDQEAMNYTAPRQYNEGKNPPRPASRKNIDDPFYTPSPLGRFKREQNVQYYGGALQGSDRANKELTHGTQQHEKRSALQSHSMNVVDANSPEQLHSSSVSPEQLSIASAPHGFV